MFTTRRSLGLMIAVCGVLAGEVFAQGNNNQNNNQNNASGIKVDAQGVVSFALANDSAGVLDKKRREAAAKKNAVGDSSKRSDQRLVSLVKKRV